MVAEIGEGGIHHLGKAEAVGHDGTFLEIPSELGVLFSEPGAMEIEVHATHLIHKFEQQFWGVVVGHIDNLGKHALRVQGLNVLQFNGSAASDAHQVAHLEQCNSHGASHARGRTHHHGASRRVHAFVVHFCHTRIILARKDRKKEEKIHCGRDTDTFCQ